MNSSFRVTGLVLAAGCSSRLGQPKQLIEFGGKCLVARAVEQLLSAGCSSVMTVLGSGADRIHPQLEHLATEILVNHAWETGMASSIRTAMEHVPKTADAVLIALCDQPLIETDHYRNLIDSVSADECSILATEYPNGNGGVPAVFSRLHFEILSKLDGSVGAKKLIQANKHKLCPIKGQHLDLDTMDDLAELQKLSVKT